MTVIQQQRANLIGHVDGFVARFQSKEYLLDDMPFGAESRVTDEVLQSISSGFNRQENTAYFDRSSEVVKIDTVFGDPAAFLARLHDGSQKVKIGSTPEYKI